MSFDECAECGFVVLAESASDPAPKRVDECPGCGRDEFVFADE